MIEASAEESWDSWLDALETGCDMRSVAGLRCLLSRPIAAEVASKGGASRAARLQEVHRVLAEAAEIEEEHGPGAALDREHPMNRMLDRARARIRAREAKRGPPMQLSRRLQLRKAEQSLVPTSDAQFGHKATIIGE